MKKIFLLAALIGGFFSAASAKDGYKLTVKFTDKKLKDSLVYLVHYYGKPLPNVYKTDSAKFDGNNVAVFNSKENVTGGIYLMLLQDHSTFFEFLLNNGDDMSIIAKSTELPEGLTFKGSPENDRFIAYEHFLKDFSKRQSGLQRELTNSKTKSDTDAVRKKGVAAGKELMDYRMDYITKYHGTLLANIFQAIMVPQVPEGSHKLPNGREDSTYPYRYYKSHYWDGFNFQDDRLILTPIYDAKLDEYINKVCVPLIDSQKMESDTLLARAMGTKELFKYTLWWMTRNAEESKIMGMDELFVHLVERYYMKGYASWLSQEDVEKYTKRAQAIAPNVLGNLAPEIVMQDINGKQVNLSSVNAKYTVLVFWTPTCGHCQAEMPKLDSAYRASLKDKGVKIYAVRTEDDPKQWQDFIKEHKMTDWINVYDPDHHSDFRAKYDVYQTPVIYLLDDKKIIIGKKLDHSNIGQVIEMQERKKKTAQAH